MLGNPELGVRAIVHPCYKHPTPDEGIALGPGRHHFVGITPEHVRILSKIHTSIGNVWLIRENPCRVQSSKVYYQWDASWLNLSPTARESNGFTGVYQSFCPQSASLLLVHCSSLLRRCRYASEMLFCLFITIDSTYTPDLRTGSATPNISNTSKRTACPTVNWSVWLTGSGRIAPASLLYYPDQVRTFKFKN